LSLVGLAEARTLLLRDLSSLVSESVALDGALGRTLASTVIASHTQPAEPRATMDGIAVLEVEPTVGTEWRLVGETPAGSGMAAPLGSGEAIRVATGAVVPEGCTRVLPQEILEISGKRASLKSQPGTAEFIRRPGADFTLGERLLEKGVRIGPGELGLIAAANLSSAEVVREPRVGICAAGDELVSPGSILREGQSVDSASHSLDALVRRWGGVPQVLPILPDDVQAITTGLRSALKTCDILICIGGASVGRRDLMRPSAAALGAQFSFEGIAVQPGKPCWHARLDPGRLILGLPGNPSSAFVCAHLLLKPLIDTLMSRRAVVTFRQARSKIPLPANGEREQYLRATASYDGEGRLWAEKIADQDSGLQANLAWAQLLIRRLPGAEPLGRGAQVEVMELASA
jgi:molybdopterin molybdotransferase